MTLPPGFADLEPFVADWAHADFEARFDARYSADMKAITEFYHAMLPRADALLAVIEKQDLTALEGDNLNGYRLLMSLAHCALAVERHKQPRAPNTQYPNSVRIVKGPLPA